MGADRTKPDHQATGAYERNWQVHRNREADHEVLAGQELYPQRKRQEIRQVGSAG